MISIEKYLYSDIVRNNEYFQFFDVRKVLNWCPIPIFQGFLNDTGETTLTTECVCVCVCVCVVHALKGSGCNRREACTS